MTADCLICVNLATIIVRCINKDINYYSLICNIADKNPTSCLHNLILNLLVWNIWKASVEGQIAFLGSVAPFQRYILMHQNLHY